MTGRITKKHPKPESEEYRFRQSLNPRQLKAIKNAEHNELPVGYLLAVVMVLVYVSSLLDSLCLWVHRSGSAAHSTYIISNGLPDWLIVCLVVSYVVLIVYANRKKTSLRIAARLFGGIYREYLYVKMRDTGITETVSQRFMRTWLWAVVVAMMWTTAVVCACQSYIEISPKGITVGRPFTMGPSFHYWSDVSKISMDVIEHHGRHEHYSPFRWSSNYEIIFRDDTAVTTPDSDSVQWGRISEAMDYAKSQIKKP